MHNSKTPDEIVTIVIDAVFNCGLFGVFLPLPYTQGNYWYDISPGSRLNQHGLLAYNHDVVGRKELLVRFLCEVTQHSYLGSCHLPRPAIKTSYYEYCFLFLFSFLFRIFLF